MTKGTLSNGFKYAIGDNALKDYSYIIEASRFRKDPEDFELFDKLLTILLGEEQKIKFVESFMDKEGNVPVDVLIAGFKELTDDASAKNKELKN